MTRLVVVLLALVGIAAGAWTLPEQHREMSGKPRDYRDRTDRALDLLGELRTPLAMMVFYKMDLYHELMTEQRVASNQQTELLPLLRLTTYLDPTIDEAYDLMAYDLLRGHARSAEAVQLLREGLVYSPNSFTLNFRLAQHLLYHREYAQAVPYFDTAIRFPRPDQGEMDIVNCLSQLYHCYAGLKNLQAQQMVVNTLTQLEPGRPRAARLQKEIDEGRSFHDVQLPTGLQKGGNY